MKETERIADQLARAFTGDAWHGPSVVEVIADIEASHAASRPMKAAHSIWELVLHIAAWEGACLRRLQGDPARLSADEDWPAVTDTTEAAWQQTIETLKQGNARLRSAILDVAESRLDQPIVAGSSSVYNTLHGVIQHDLYHAGQIALLKKVIQGSDKL